MGMQGSVKVLVTTMPDGQVRSVEMESSSGSPWLDLALEDMFRAARNCRHCPKVPGPSRCRSTSRCITF